MTTDSGISMTDLDQTPYSLTSRPGPDKRLWFADGEDLAEGGIVKWLEELRPYLEGQGVKIISMADTEYGENYRLRINGRDVTVYEDAGPDCWLLASVQAARIANWLLESAGSPERGYMIYTGGNEGLIQFMKPDSAEYTAAFGDRRISERPDDFGTLDAPIGEEQSVQ